MIINFCFAYICKWTDYTNF